MSRPVLLALATIRVWFRRAKRAGVIVAGLDHRPEGLGAGRRVVDLPPPGGEAGESLGVMSWTRWWSEALGAVSTPDPGRRCLVVLDGGRLCGRETLACAAGLIRMLSADSERAENQVVWVSSETDWQVRSSAVAAYGQIARLEQGGLSWTSVGVAEPVGDDEAVRIAMRELASASPGSAEVRYVDGHRAVRVLEESRTPRRCSTTGARG